MAKIGICEECKGEFVMYCKGLCKRCHSRNKAREKVISHKSASASSKEEKK